MTRTVEFGDLPRTFCTELQLEPTSYPQAEEHLQQHLA